MKMRGLGIGGRLFNWVLDFLAGRTIRVKVGDVLSEVFKVVNGIPQGSSISPVLFAIMMDDVFCSLGVGIKFAIYADDGAICKRGRNLGHVVSAMQKAIRQVESWTLDWGFRLSVEKSCYMLIARRRKLDHARLQLYGQDLERVDTFKYLGLWIDTKCTWQAHVDHVVAKCKKVLNLMRAVVGRDWGADTRSLLGLYRTLMRSSIDYGCVVYAAAAKSVVAAIDRVQYSALRLSLGAIRSTPVNALLVGAGEMPLSLRREKLALAYWSRLRGAGESQPAKKVLDDCWEYSLRGSGFGWTVGAAAEKYGMSVLDIGPHTVWGAVPPWIFPVPEVDFGLMGRKADWVEQGIAMGPRVQEYVRRAHYMYLPVFTDGSKDPESGRVGAGVYVGEFEVVVSRRLSDRLSVFTAELVAIILGLQWVEDVRPDRVLVCSDSAAALQSLSSKDALRNDLVLDVLMLLLRLQRAGVSVRFCWVPAHVGVEGNERADSVAKGALRLADGAVLQIPYGKGEAKSLIRAAVGKTWQEGWDKDAKGRHFHGIQRAVAGWTGRGRCRREEVVHSRMRFGHTRLNSTLNMMGKHATGNCDVCDVSETVEHVLMVCIRYSVERAVLRARMGELGREWSVRGVLGVGKNLEECDRALFSFLGATGLMLRI